MKKIRVIFASAFIMACMLVLNVISAMAASPNVTIAVSTPDAQTGSTVVIAVTMEDATGIIGGGYKVLVGTVEIGSVDFDSAAEFNFSGTFTPEADGQYIVTLAAIDGSITGGPEIILDDTTTVLSISYSPVTITATTPVVCAHESLTLIVDTPATCGVNGIGHHVCASCGVNVGDPVPIPATGEHTFENGKCTFCGADDPNYVAVVPVSIEVAYSGALNKNLGEAVKAEEIAVTVVFSDGTKVPVADGWTCPLAGVGLVAGDIPITVDYGGLTASFTVHVTDPNAATQPVETQPVETQPVETQPVETQPEETTEETSETESQVDETTTAEENPGTTAYITIVSPFGGDNLYMATKWDADKAKNMNGFKQSKITYAGNDVQTIVNDAGLTLVYLTDNTGSNGDFYIYDEASNKFSYYISIPGNTVNYYILAFPDDFNSQGMSKMIITLDAQTNKSVTGYHLSSDKEASGYVCLVYAMDAEGNKGYYRFDTETLSFVRYYQDAAAKTETETKPAEEETSAVAPTQASGNGVSYDEYNSLVAKYNNDIKLRFIVIAVLIALAVVLFIFVLILALKLRKLYNDYDFEDDDDDESEEEEEEDEEEEEEEEEDEESEDEDFRVDLSGIEDDEE